MERDEFFVNNANKAVVQTQENLTSTLPSGGLPAEAINTVNQSSIIPSNLDWTEQQFAAPYYISTTRIGFNNNFDATKFLTTGDKLRFKQSGGTYKYMYVLWVKSSYIEVTGGSTYTVANEAITSFAFSKSTKPDGFPMLMSYSATWSKVSGAGTLSFHPTNSSREAGFFMNGSMMTVKGYASYAQYNGADKPILNITLPVADFVYGDSDGDGDVDADDYAIAVANMPSDKVLFLHISGETVGTIGYRDEGLSPIQQVAAISLSGVASPVTSYLSSPAKVVILPLTNLSSSYLYFGFEVSFLFSYYGP